MSFAGGGREGVGVVLVPVLWSSYTSSTCKLFLVELKNEDKKVYLGLEMQPRLDPPIVVSSPSHVIVSVISNLEYM